MGNGSESKVFVVGWPIDHSRSPIIHNYWIEQHGLKGSYERQACPPEDFERFLASMEGAGFIGGNVTIPHKEAAFRGVGWCDGTAQALGAVNTLWLDGGQICGSNTDGYGFLANLDDLAPGWSSVENLDRGALVIGAGGASRAVVHALVERGFKTVVIANRTLERAQQLAENFGPACLATGLADALDRLPAPAFVVNTTSLGMGKNVELPIDVSGLPEDTLVHDIVYTPLVTPLLGAARKSGLRTVDGLGMLLHQAVPGFERWFGIRPEVTAELRALVLAGTKDAP